MCVFKFEEIFYDKRVAAGAAHKTCLAAHPGERLEEVIAADLNISRGECGFGAAKQDILSRSLQKIVDDFVGTHGIVTYAAPNRRRICACTGYCGAVQVGKERIDDGDMRAAAESDAFIGVILRRAMQPHAVEYEVIGGSAGF